MKALHDSRNETYRAPYGAVELGTSVNLAIDIEDAPGATAKLRTWVDGRGEMLYDMTPVALGDADAPMTAGEASAASPEADAGAAVAGAAVSEGPVRYCATLAPDEPGIVWYQFVLEDADGNALRYGACDGRTGGEGRLASWEPPSFQLTVFDPASAAAATPDCNWNDCLVDYLCGRKSAYDLAETVESLRENCPASAFDASFDLVAIADRSRLMVELAGARPDQENRCDIDEGSWGQAKGRLWCASLVQLLGGGACTPDAAAPGLAALADNAEEGLEEAPDAPEDCAASGAPAGDAAGLSRLTSANDLGSLVRAWEALDSDCGAIVGNVADLRSTLALFGPGRSRFCALNDDVLAVWRHGSETAGGMAGAGGADSAGSTGNADAPTCAGAAANACILVNRSLHHAHDVRVPLAGAFASELISGHGVDVQRCASADAPAAAQAALGSACVHMGPLGSAILYFHDSPRLERPMQPGIGVLAHITSLPGRGRGTLGKPARNFVDWLAKAGMHYWQVLPVNPTDVFGSPYAGISAFAGNDHLMEAPSGQAGRSGAAGTADAMAAAGDEAANADPAAYRAFCESERDWLEPYAAFRAIRRKLATNAMWQDWPEPYRRYDPAVVEADDELRSCAERWRRIQFAFERQWHELRAYANERGIAIVGDMPIYVSADSSDVWANPDLFQLGADGKPDFIAGCPPDAFALEGQVWGNPLYDWDVLQADGYAWWMRRLQRAFDLYDYVRLDHFIGFLRYFSIPAGQKAAEGTYRPGPGLRLFQAAFDRFGPLPIIAEDLGAITPAVRALSAACGFPGMDIVQFADGNDPLAGYFPRPEKIAYTGTHDNQTLVGYVHDRYPNLDARAGASQLAEAAAACSADVCILPLQDIIGLDDDARMNVPGTAEGNWVWKAKAADVKAALPRARQLADLHRASR